jgi:hypothetical protein
MKPQLKGRIIQAACLQPKCAYLISLVLACCVLALDAQQQLPHVKGHRALSPIRQVSV